ncbi:MAG: hypothetical protein JSW45_11600 [Thiotrichales bacterium]|nr:MAG: hypothetical protein JSW45_11600 [Thiotrichales bacterium]
MKPKLIIFVLSIAISSYPLLSLAQGSGLDPSRVKWTGLNYKTRILFFPMNIEVQMNQISLATSKAALLTPKHGRGTMPQSDPTYRIDLDTKILGRNSFISLWFDPDGTAFQRTQTDTGKKHRIKTYRILKNGFYSRQARPRENEKELPPEKWTDFGEGSNEFNRLAPAGTITTEPTALYYLVSASPLNKPGDKFVQHIFTKHGIYRLELQAMDYEYIEVDFESNQSAGEKSIYDDEFRALHIRLNGVAIDPASQGNFELLGLKGDIDLYMDPETRVLVQVSGKLDIVGYKDIKLKAVTFR